MNPEKLAKLQAQARTASKGTPRRVIKKVHRPVAQDDRKLQAALDKLNLVNLPAVEEVNMFKAQGTVLNFRAPKVHTAATSNTYAIYGRPEVKSLKDIVPGYLDQLGPDALAQLRRLAQSYQETSAGRAAMAASGLTPEDLADDEDDEVPDLVESFEETSIQEETQA